LGQERSILWIFVIFENFQYLIHFQRRFDCICLITATASVWEMSKIKIECVDLTILWIGTHREN
jgi:hypothetical protein